MAVGYLNLFGNPGAISTPDHASLDHTTDFEAIACVAPDNWAPEQVIFQKNSAYRYEILNFGVNGQKVLVWESAVIKFKDEPLDNDVNGQHLWIRATIDLNGNWTWYESTDPIGTAVGSLSWGQTGQDTHTVTAIDSTSGALWVGGAGFGYLIGKIHYVEMRDDATGAGATLFKLDFRDTSQADWSNLGAGVTVDSRVWTATGVKGTDWDYTPDPAGSDLAAGWGVETR